MSKNGFRGMGISFQIRHPHVDLAFYPAPIAATNEIEDRHKVGTVLKQHYSVGLLRNLQYFGALRLRSGP